MGYDDAGLSISLKDGRVLARLESESRGYEIKSAAGVIKAGVENQVAVSFGDKGFCLYVGGKLVDQVNYSGGITQNKEPIVLGANTHRSHNATDNLKDCFDGSIGGVVVYDQELNASHGLTADHLFLA